MELFDGDSDKVKKLDKMVTAKMGFQEAYPVTGQTYSRKVDALVLNALSSIAQSAHKFASDIRLLQHLKEVEEPFEKSQIGSSAMAYKRNPMRSERICSLAKYVMTDAMNPAMVYATQWFERTLDDSANKRIAVPEAFLAVDAILNIMINVTDGLVIHPKVIENRILSELPFMATENIMMSAVKKGKDRQDLHEAIREHSMMAAKVVKDEGKPNDLIERILADQETFDLTKDDLKDIMKLENYIGRAPQQVSELLDEVIKPVLEANEELLGVDVELKV